MIAKLISLLLVVAGIIKLIPLRGVLGPEHLSALYGIPVGEPNLELLMRHRAVLLGLVGALLVYAAFKPSYQPIAIVAGVLSASSFLWLARSVGVSSAAIGKVVIADSVVLVCSVMSGVLAWRISRTL